MTTTPNDMFVMFAIPLLCTVSKPGPMSGGVRSGERVVHSTKHVPFKE